MVNVFNIGEGIGFAFYGVCIMLDSFIFWLISSFFKIFMSLASAQILTSDAYTSIADKVYMIIGVVMLFVLAYGLLRAVIDPDKSKNGDLSGTKVLKSLIVAVVGLAATPVIFNLMYKGQEVFLKNDVIAAIFFRSDTAVAHFDDIQMSTNVSNSNEGAATNASSSFNVPIGDVEYNKYIKNIGGAVTATYLWQAFFRPDPSAFAENYSEAAKLVKGDYEKLFTSRVSSSALLCGLGAAALVVVGAVTGVITGGAGFAIAGAGVAVAAGTCAAIAASQNNILLDKENLTLEAAYNYSAATGDFTVYQAFIPNILDDDTDLGKVSYIWFISAIVGLFACYCFLTFSIDMAVRAAKLAYYQIIAPIPIILQIVPKFKDMFNKYIRAVINTFLEVFIRISVVYIVVYFISHLNDLFSFGVETSNVDLNAPEKLIAQVILILGLIAFAKKLPDLISDTFGIAGGGKGMFNLRQKLADGNLFGAGAVAGAAITGGVQNWRNTWKKSKDDNPDIGFGKRLAKTATSSLGGFGSSFSRAAYSQFLAPNHSTAVNAKDMRDAAGRAAEESSNARVRRAERSKNIKDELMKNANKAADKAYERTLEAEKNAGKTDIEAEVAAIKARDAVYNKGKGRLVDRVGTDVEVRFRNLRDTAYAWSWGTLDTSEMDGLAALEAKYEGLEKQLGDAIANKDSGIQAAQSRIDNLNKNGRNDIAYELEAKRRAAVQYWQNQMLTRNVGEDDASYESRLTSFLNTDDSQLTQDEIDARNKYRLAMASNINQEGVLLENNDEFNRLVEKIKTDRTRSDYLTKDNVSYNADSEMGDMVEAELRKQLSDAGAALKAAKRDAISRQIAEHSLTGVVNDVSKLMEDFFVETQGELRKYQHAAFKDGKTVGEFMRDYFGGDVLIDGKLDFSKLLKDTKATFNMDLGNDLHVVYNNIGDKPEIEIKNSAGANVVTDDNGDPVVFNSEQSFKDYIAQNYAGESLKVTSTANNKASSAVSTLKDSAERAARDLKGSPAWREAQSRKQKERERKQNSNK